MPAEDPDQLREDLVDTLQRNGALHSDAIAHAIRSVPRHDFAPWLPIHQAYTDAAFPVPTANGDGLSSISQPSTVSLMLETLDPNLGHRVLEIGTGTGYNAALLATIVGPTGDVTTIDIEPDLTERAGARLQENHITNAHVICRDGIKGCPERAPFDRIIATVGVQEVPWAWADQLTDRGIILAPVRLGGQPQDHVLLRLRKEDGHLVGEGIDTVAIIVLRREDTEPATFPSGLQGPDWYGVPVNALHVRIYPAVEHREPRPAQKVLPRAHSTIVLERRHR